MLYITGLSASALGVLAVMLALKIVGLRRDNKISIGDGDNPDLQKAIRTHANLLEYAPIGLILIACAELNGVSRWLLAILALAFVAGRFLHPAGMNKPDNMKARVLGMQLTLISILVLAAINVLWVLWRLVAG
jgi:uncharacterized membrane protein YecN with MAPEG domain